MNQYSPGMNCWFIVLSLAATVRADAPPESLIGVEHTVRLALPAGVRAADSADSPVRLRIGDVQTTPEAGDYDVHYEVRESGVYDLRGFLQGMDSRTGTGPVLVKGVSHLAADDSGKLDSVEPTPFPSYGGYTVARRVAIGTWGAVFLILVLWRRAKKTAIDPVAVETESLPDPRECMENLLTAARERPLTVPETVELELRVWAHWREHLKLTQEPVDVAMRSLRRDSKGAKALKAIEDWLHVPPARSVTADPNTLRWTDGYDAGPAKSVSVKASH